MGDQCEVSRLINKLMSIIALTHLDLTMILKQTEDNLPEPNPMDRADEYKAKLERVRKLARRSLATLEQPSDKVLTAAVQDRAKYEAQTVTLWNEFHDIYEFLDTLKIDVTTPEEIANFTIRLRSWIQRVLRENTPRGQKNELIDTNPCM